MLFQCIIISHKTTKKNIPNRTYYSQLWIWSTQFGIFYSLRDWPDMEKEIFLHEQGLSQNEFTQNRCVSYNNIEFARKQHKKYLTTGMSTIGLSHNYKGNIYVINKRNSSFLSNSLSLQNSIEFVKDFSQTMKKITQALLAPSYAFPSMGLSWLRNQQSPI